MRQNTQFYPSFFFKFTQATFGKFSLKLLKLWIKHRKIIIRNSLRIKFLKFCVRNNIIPQHLYYFYQHNINLSYYGSIIRFERLKYSHTMKLLKIELNDAFRTLHRTQIFHLEKRLSQCIPTYIDNSFLEKQKQSLYCFYPGGP